ncbi:unnamed protein product [Prorocentrum cordatum]|uniref:Uncharacterized protein n=1 Tax=Prorocentrum cordatum TaxID=2364126 RepID=A0ABN9UW51_9DINO|nr:unnamed protein product [Polarella glacialis]
MSAALAARSAPAAVPEGGPPPPECAAGSAAAAPPVLSLRQVIFDPAGCLSVPLVAVGGCVVVLDLEAGRLDLSADGAKLIVSLARLDRASADGLRRRGAGGRRRPRAQGEAAHLPGGARGQQRAGGVMAQPSSSSLEGGKTHSHNESSIPQKIWEKMGKQLHIHTNVQSPARISRVRPGGASRPARARSARQGGGVPSAAPGRLRGPRRRCRRTAYLLRCCI